MDLLTFFFGTVKVFLPVLLPYSPFLDLEDGRGAGSRLSL